MVYYQDHTAARDSSFNKDSNDQLLRAQFRFEFEMIQEKEQVNKDKQQLVAKEANRWQNIIKFSLVAIVIVLSVMLGLLFRGYLHKKKLSKVLLLHASDTKFPLIKMLLSVPMYKRMYLAHIKTIMLENFDNKSYYDSGLSMQATIDAAVSADIYKFYTYSNFLNNLTTDISSGMGGPGSSSTPGITNLMNGRNSYLLALSDFTNTAPGITDITLSDAKPVINSTITVSASITNATSVYLGFRSSSELPFTRIQMYDDGTHNDLVAGDGIYSTPLTIDNASIQYYIYAENDKVGMFSPQRAEHEYHESIWYEECYAGEYEPGN